MPPPSRPSKAKRNKSRGGSKKRKKKRRRGPGLSIAEALLYPLKGNGPLVLGLYGILLWIVPFIPLMVFQAIAALLVAAFVGLLFLETANFTLEGIEHPPRFPDFSLEMFGAGMMALVAIMIGMIPSYVGGYLGLLGIPIARLLLMAATMYYVPMAFVVLADRENEAALNPLLVLRQITRMPFSYLSLVTAAALLYVVPSLGLMFAPVPELVGLFAQPFLLLYSVTALMRAVGRVYLARGLRGV